MTNIDPSGPWRRSIGDADGAGGSPPQTPPATKPPEASPAERYDAFAKGGAGSGACDDVFSPDFDFDRCVDHPISKPVLFSKEPGDADEIDPADVRQRVLGDCNLMAPLAALASTPEGRALVRRSIVEQKNDKGETQGYVVTLHEPERHFFKATTFRDVEVKIDANFAKGHAKERPSGEMNEIWPIVIEKAYAQYSGGYNVINGGGEIARTMEVLTGRAATWTPFSPIQRLIGSFSANTLRQDLAAGKIVVLVARKGIPEVYSEPGVVSSANPYNLFADHCYAVSGTEERDGRVFVQLRNPWGHADPRPVAVDDLAKWFKSVTVGSVR